MQRQQRALIAKSFEASGAPNAEARAALLASLVARNDNCVPGNTPEASILLRMAHYTVDDQLKAERYSSKIRFLASKLEELGVKDAVYLIRRLIKIHEDKGAKSGLDQIQARIANGYGLYIQVLANIGMEHIKFKDNKPPVLALGL